MSKVSASREFAAMADWAVFVASDLATGVEGRTALFEKEGPEGVRYLCRSLAGTTYFPLRMKVTPVLAQQWLALEGEERLKNRPSNEETVNAYATDIGDDNWLETGEAFTFDKNGTLWNGGHRARAIIKAGKPIMSLVVFGIERDAFFQMDSGRMRTISNFLHFLGERDVSALNTAATRLMAWETGLFVRPANAEKRTRQQLQAYLRKYPEVRDAVRWGRLMSRDVPGLSPAAAIILVVLLDRTGKPQEAEEFLTKLRSGAMLDERTSVYHLREKVLRRGVRRVGGRAGRSLLTLEEQLAFAITAWNRRGEDNVKLLKVPGALTDKNFPQPDGYYVKPRENRKVRPATDDGQEPPASGEPLLDGRPRPLAVEVHLRVTRGHTGLVAGSEDSAPPLDPELKARIDQMAADFVPQVRAEAWKIYSRAPHALELEEMVSLGLLGMTQAVAAWPGYCAKNNYDPAAVNYLIAYILKRVRGAMLDALRSQDWVTRSARTKAKALRSAGQDMGLGEAELAAAAGMTVQEVRDTIAAVAARPVSLDAEPHDVASPSSVESEAVVSSVLEASSMALGQFPPRVQALVALRYYYGVPLESAASVIGLEQAEAQRAHEEAIIAMHSAMVRAVT